MREACGTFTAFPNAILGPCATCGLTLGKHLDVQAEQDCARCEGRALITTWSIKLNKWRTLPCKACKGKGKVVPS